MMDNNDTATMTKRYNINPMRFRDIEIYQMQRYFSPSIDVIDDRYRCWYKLRAKIEGRVNKHLFIDYKVAAD